MKTEKLLELEYYVDKVSLAMKNDAIFMHEISDLVKYLQKYDATIRQFEDAIYKLLYEIINDKDEQQEIDEYKYSDLLDKIASIFNLSRVFEVDFKNPLTNIVDTTMKTAFDDFKETSFVDGHLKTTMSLSNNQLRLLIYCAIMKNSYDGSYEMLDKVYRTVCKFIAKDIPAATSWKIYQQTKYDVIEGVAHASPGIVDCIFAFNNYTFSEDNIDMSQYFTLFFGGYLTIQSAGIYCNFVSADLASLLYWSPEDDDPNNPIKDINRWTDTSTDPETVRRWL